MTVAEPDVLPEWPVLDFDDDDVCHILRTRGRAEKVMGTWCGAPRPKPHTGGTYKGEEVCSGCGRTICHVCRRRVAEYDRGG